jgi:voltage-gated potassium channel
VRESFRPQRLVGAFVAAVLVLLVGTIGFSLALDESWEDAFYRSAVTASLTGLDSRPEGTAAELLTIGLVLSGLTIFAYVAAVIVESIARGIFTGALLEKRRRRSIGRLEDHFIICGYGRVGRRAGQELREAGVAYVVLDFSPEAKQAAAGRADLFVEGRGTDDDALDRAGLARARGLLASADSDADNLYVTLSARAVRPDLFIVARASDEDAAKKLRLAGADRVVLPYSSAGREMANFALKPQVAAFLDVVSSTGSPSFRLEEIEIAESCVHAGSSIRELRVRDRTGAMIVALRKRDGTFDTTPTPDALLDAGDVLIGVGTDEELQALEELFAPSETPVAG